MQLDRGPLAFSLQLFGPHLLPPFLVPGCPYTPFPPIPPPPLTVLELVHALPQRPEVGVVQGCLGGYAALRFVLKAQGPVGSWLAGCRNPFGTRSPSAKLDAHVGGARV